MTTSAQDDRNYESTINDALARLLRERMGLNAASETLQRGRRPDIIVRLQNRAVILELELEPALTVEQDALSKLGMRIDGRPVQNVFAVIAPIQLRTIEQRHLPERLASAALQWQEWRADGSSGPKLSGDFTDLGNAVSRVPPPSGNIDLAIERLETGVRYAGGSLHNSQGALGRVAAALNTGVGEEAANMAALVVINAMMFQERLVSANPDFQPLKAIRADDDRNMQDPLLQEWRRILAVDYYPIFGMATEVVNAMSELESPDFLRICADAASNVLRIAAFGQHDIAGKIFNRLVAERKLLAAFYTRIPSSTLLAGLALPADDSLGIDWADADSIANLRVIDPACGTGTLLMAAYRQVMQNHAATGASAPPDELHRALVERVIMGADVVQSAIHLTAATLAAMSTTAEFEKMELYTLRLGVEETRVGEEVKTEVRLGSLEWLKSSGVQAHFSGTQERMGAVNGDGGVVHTPQVDLVISNPPYTRRGSDGGNEEAIARVFDLPENDPDKEEALKRATSALLKGTPANQIAGHGTSFLVLADKMVKPGGRIAFVLPYTALAGESWAGVRRMLAERYSVEFVICSHDTELPSFSFDTKIAETLIVARRLRKDEEPPGVAKFVNLWRGLDSETDALALTRAIRNAASLPVHRADGPLAGGSALMLGADQWGEIVESPIDGAPWKAARWQRALICQFAAAVERGELHRFDGLRSLGRIPVAPLGEVCNVGPQHRQIRGSIGRFDGYHGYDPQAQFPALWALDSNVHQGFTAQPNARLIPQPGRDYAPIWEQSGALQIAVTVRYNAQPIMAVRTGARALGVASWHTLIINEEDYTTQSAREIALALWLNSTFGFLLHANRSIRSQLGRGTGNKNMLREMFTLDVRQLQEWQLDAALAIWRDFQDKTFEPFHRCAVDANRIELDRRMMNDMIGLDGEAQEAMAQLRLALANDPSIRGDKDPALP